MPSVAQQPPLFNLERTCTKCGETKPASSFPESKGKNGGLQPCCQECINARRRKAVKKWHDANKERATAANRAWHAAHPEYAKAWNTENAERRRQYTRKWRAANPDKEREGRRKSYAASRERNIAKAREWNIANRDKMRERERARYAKDPAPYLSKNHLRRAMQLNAPGRATAADIAARWAMWGDSCYMCGAPATCTDHVIALTRGGSNWPANLRPACTSCNARKGNKDWRQFAPR